MGIRFIEENLSMQIVHCDKVTIDQDQAPDSGPSKQLGGCTAGCTATDNRNRRQAKPLLP
jgi:hypothetical protein